MQGMHRLKPTCVNKITAGSGIQGLSLSASVGGPDA